MPTMRKTAPNTATIRDTRTIAVAISPAPGPRPTSTKPSKTTPTALRMIKPPKTIQIIPAVSTVPGKGGSDLAKGLGVPYDIGLSPLALVRFLQGTRHACHVHLHGLFGRVGVVRPDGVDDIAMQLLAAIAVPRPGCGVHHAR